jgi:hypothetical protein
LNFEGRRKKRRARRPGLSTSTLLPSGKIVPWLAARGPLAYNPEDPPDRDYYFQYSWVLPGIFSDKTNIRRHYFFGAGNKDAASELFQFWTAAREGRVERLACCLGTVEKEAVTAPVAVYRTKVRIDRAGYLFIQHGSYQFIEAAYQPRLDVGDVLLYRGVQRSDAFQLFRVGRGDLDVRKRRLWQTYVNLQAYLMSDSVRSFNSIHDRARRAETGHIRDGSWISEEIAGKYGLDIEHNGFAKDLWKMTHQSFSLAPWVAENKFGPNFVVCKTPLDNIRLTTFFAGEHEVRIVDPDRVEIVEANGCHVECQR